MVISPSSSSSSFVHSTQRTEVLYGAKSAVAKGVQFMRNVKNRMDITFDSKAPSIVVKVKEYKNGYIDIRRRGGKIRAITEITQDNISYSYS